MSKQHTFTIEVGNRSAQASVQTRGGQYQINVFHPGNGGAGFFLVFPEQKRVSALSAARKLIQGPALEPDQDITAQVEGALAAGTVGMPKVHFGIPHVAHASN